MCQKANMNPQKISQKINVGLIKTEEFYADYKLVEMG
jgi:hypothetical protein